MRRRVLTLTHGVLYTHGIPHAVVHTLCTYYNIRTSAFYYYYYYYYY